MAAIAAFNSELCMQATKKSFWCFGDDGQQQLFQHLFMASVARLMMPQLLDYMMDCKTHDLFTCLCAEAEFQCLTTVLAKKESSATHPGAD